MSLREFSKVTISHDNSLFTLIIFVYRPIECFFGRLWCILIYFEWIYTILHSWISVDLKNTIFKQNFRKFDCLISILNGCRLPWQHNIGQFNEVYSGHILYVCSCGAWDIYMPSFQIYIWSIRICLKITKMTRPHRRPMSKRPDCYELIATVTWLLC